MSPLLPKKPEPHKSYRVWSGLGSDYTALYEKGLKRHRKRGEGLRFKNERIFKP